MNRILCFAADQRGLATIEYTLLLSLIGIVIAVAISALAVAVQGQLKDTILDITG